MQIENKRIAILIADYFDEIEFWYPYYRMQEAGAKVTVIGPERSIYKGKNGMTFKAEVGIEHAKVDNYDAVIIPGGFAPDYLRREPEVVDFVRRINEQSKTCAAICHGPWLFASANILRNRIVTSFHSIKDDMVNAGAYWIDQNVVLDGHLITSRNADDLPVFCHAIIDQLANGVKNTDDENEDITEA